MYSNRVRCSFSCREGKVKLNVDLAPGEKEEPFAPNLVNSTVFIICLALQVSTFAVNHKVFASKTSLRN